MTNTEAGRKEPSPHVPSDRFRQALGDYLDSALKGERTVVTRNGKPVAGLVPIADLERLERLDAEEADEPARLVA